MEWAQGVFFAGVFQDFTDPKSFESPNDLKNFDDHAIYYSINPHEWPDLPFLHGEQYSMPAETGKERTVEESLRTLRQYLQKHDIRMFFRDLSSIEATQAGVRVLRALSPDCAMIFAHQQWPLLHKVKNMAAIRYPNLGSESKFPYLMPHPLG